MSGVRALIGALDALVGPAAMAVAGAADRGLVLLYHRVSPTTDPVYPPLSPDDFDAHLDLVASRFDVLSATHFAERLQAGGSLRRCCTLTFDDGYRDFLEHALPRLRKRGLPSTQFLVADCLEGGVEPWTLRARRVQLSEELDTLGAMPGDQRDRRLHKAEVSVARAPAGAEMMRTPDVPTLLAAGVEIGSHTASHAWLPRVDDAELEKELAGSRRTLSELCGQEVTMVSYPQGLHDARVRAAAVGAGYSVGFGVDQRATRPSTDPMAVPRFDLTDRPAAMLRLELSGAIPALRRLRRM